MQSLSPKYLTLDIIQSSENNSKQTVPLTTLNQPKKIISFERSFASNPRSQFWSVKNQLLPTEVYLKSGKEYLFDCDVCKHEISKRLSEVQKGSWCPFCSKPPKKLCSNQDCLLCYEKSFASHERAKYWSNKNIDNPRFVFKSSNKAFHFDCDVCFHTFNKVLYSAIDTWCPYCANQKLCDDNDCVSCYNKSLASLNINKYWSNKNIKSPREVFKNSDKSFIFECCHIFEAKALNITKGEWCPFCSCPPKQLCNDPNCYICHEKSFASHEKAKYWSKDNQIDPRNVFKSTGALYKFDCYCGHTFHAPLFSVSSRDSWCPFCSSPPKQLCNKHDCLTCYEKSFVSHEKAKYWLNTNLETPRSVFKFSNKKYKFICEYCNNIYESSPNKINMGRWCSCRKKKTETKLYNFLLLNYPEKSIEPQKTFDWCRSIKGRYLPFDFFIKDFNLIIELDGIQHFIQVSNWKSPELNQQNDHFKMQLANRHGYSIIRIFQEDVLYDKNDWQNKLKAVFKYNQDATIILIGDIYQDLPKTNLIDRNSY